LPKETTDFRKGHRQRLREKFEINQFLTDAELLELFLTYAIPRVDVKPIARGLLTKFGTVSKIIAAQKEELARIKGIGKSAATFIKVLHQMTLRNYVSKLKDTPVLRDYETLSNYCLYLLDGKNVEEFHVLYLDKNYQLIEDEAHAKGTINHAAAYPREILKRALDVNAKSIILVHNHPSGSPIFSADDIKITHYVQDMMASAKIEFTDHFLVANGLMFSARAMNCFK
jgi:DNA repair protein RadC